MISLAKLNVVMSLKENVRSVTFLFSFQMEDLAYADYDYEFAPDEENEDYLDYYDEVSKCFIEEN